MIVESIPRSWSKFGLECNKCVVKGWISSTCYGRGQLIRIMLSINVAHIIHLTIYHTLGQGFFLFSFSFLNVCMSLRREGRRDNIVGNVRMGVLFHELVQAIEWDVEVKTYHYHSFISPTSDDVQWLLNFPIDNKKALLLPTLAMLSLMSFSEAAQFSFNIPRGSKQLMVRPPYPNYFTR